MIASEEYIMPKLPSPRWFILALITAILTVLVFFSSCHSTKNLSKKTTETKTETTTESTTTRTITETAQEEVKIKGDTIAAEEDIERLSEHPISVEDENLKLTVEVDAKTGKVKAKAVKKERIIPIEVNRTTFEKVEAKEKSKITEKEKTKDVHKVVESGFNWNYLWWLLLILLIPIWKYRKSLFG